MELTGWWVIVPVAVGALLTGLLMSLGTPWGLFRHYWTSISLVLTAVSTVVLIEHMPSVSAAARALRAAPDGDVRPMGGDLFHPSVGLLVLAAVMVLNVYKPTGLTPYGWRKQREARASLRRLEVSQPTAPKRIVAAIRGTTPILYRKLAVGASYSGLAYLERLVNAGLVTVDTQGALHPQPAEAVPDNHSCE